MLLSMRVDYTVGATLKNKQTLLAQQYTHSAFQLSVLAEALAIFRGHVLKLVLQVLADCESKSEGENPSKQQRFAASAGHVRIEIKFMLTLLCDKSFKNPQPRGGV